MKLYRSGPLTEREKAYLRRSKGIVLPHSAAVGPKPLDVPKEREYLTAVRADYVAPRKRRDGSGSRLSPVIRAMVQRKREANANFHAELREAFKRGE